MVFEKFTIKSDKATSGDSDKDTFSLPKSRAISDMLLVIRAKNGATHNSANGCKSETILSSIEEIEVKTGDRIFKSYNADIALAYATYKTGREPHCNLQQTTDLWQSVAIPINFTRFENDPVCSLPAPLYTDAQLSIKYDFNTTDANGDVAFLTGGAYHRYDLYADFAPFMHDASLRKQKVLTQLKVQNYTTVSSGNDLINLTTSDQKKMRNVLVRSYKTGSAEGTTLSDLAIKVNGENVATDSWRNWQNRNADDCQLIYSRALDTFAEGDNDVYYSGVCDVKPLFQAVTTTAEDVYCTTSADQVTMNGVAADDQGTLFLNSDVIPATAVIDFDRGNSMADLLDLKVNKLHLEVINAGADGAVQIYEELVEPAVIA